MDYSSKKTLDDVNVENKKVLVRVDFNVPLEDGNISDDNRIKASLPTIKYLLNKGASIILLSHLGRIETEEDKQFNTLRPIAQNLADKLGQEVKFIAQNTGQAVSEAIENLKPREIILLENTRFQDVVNDEKVKYESKNAEELGEKWASYADIFVNDAFGTAHRSHASNVGIANNINESCIGLLIQEELEKLSKGLNHPESPFIAIVGGAKVSDKIAVIENLITKADKVLIGGGMAYTFLKAQGHEIGKSLCEEDKLEIATDLLKKGESKLLIPIDSACSKIFADDKPLITKDKDVPDGYIGLDIGPQTIEMFKQAIKGAKTVVWNGPMGVSEFSNFAKGTEEICKTIAEQEDVYSVIGGGDSAAAAIKMGYAKKFTHISTGGGASLQYMEGKELPGISAIQNK